MTDHLAWRLLGAVLFATSVQFVLASMGPTAIAQEYPSRPIHLIVGSVAGGPSDIRARQIAPHLSESLNQSVIVENRPGAGGTLAAEFVARAKPDG